MHSRAAAGCRTAMAIAKASVVVSRVEIPAAAQVRLGPHRRAGGSRKTIQRCLRCCNIHPFNCLHLAAASALIWGCVWRMYGTVCDRQFVRCLNEPKLANSEAALEKSYDCYKALQSDNLAWTGRTHCVLTALGVAHWVP